MTGIVGNYYIKYYVGTDAEGNEIYSSSLAYINAGVYEVKYQIIFDNYKTLSGSHSLTINKAIPTVELANNSTEYTGSMIGYPMINTLTDGKISYQFEGIMDRPTNVGTYKLQVTVSEGTNYVEYSFVFDYEITRRVISATWPSNLTYSYNGTKIIPNYTLPTFKESLNDSLELVDGDGINVGSHTYRIVIGNSNFVLDEASVQRTITIKQVLVDYEESKTVEYQGKKPELNTVGLIYSDNYEASVGIYNLTVSLADNVNYAWSDDCKDSTRDFTLEIIAKDINSVRIICVDEATYTGSAITPKPAISYGSYNLVEGKDYTINYKNNVKAYSEAEIIITGIGNFTGVAKKTFTIKNSLLSLNSDSNYQFFEAISKTNIKESDHTAINGYRSLISNISSKTTVTELLSNFLSEQASYIKVYNSSNSVISSSKYDTTYVGTGFRIVLYNDATVAIDVVYIAVRGDLNGDGLITIADYSLLTRGVLNNTLANEFYLAADVNHDGYASAADMSMLMLHIRGTKNIDDLNKKH